MESFRKWFFKPKRDDQSLLAQFFYADEDLNMVAAELDSFDGKKDPERCASLVNHLRNCQDKVLNIVSGIMEELIPQERTSRDFRVKFPDDVMSENLAGQLWFGAECLAAGSSILNREAESAAMRPLARALTKSLENVRHLLREQCFRASANVQTHTLFTDRLLEALKIFDRLFAEFELRYVSAMVPVKSPREYLLHQMVVVLFSETLERALKLGLISQESVDDYDPALMFTIPRLAIVSGLLLYSSGPICLDRTPSEFYISEMFRPFRNLLIKIRFYLRTLSAKDLHLLERHLCSIDEPSLDLTCVENSPEETPSDPDEPSSSSSSSNDSTDLQTVDRLTVEGEADTNDGDHVESLNIVRDTLSMVLIDGEHSGEIGANLDWDKLLSGTTVSLDLPPCPSSSSSADFSQISSNYRIRTSTRHALQNFDVSPNSLPPRRKRRKYGKGRGIRVDVRLRVSSRSKRLVRTGSISSNCSSCLESLSEDSYPEYYGAVCGEDDQSKEPRIPPKDLLHRLFVCIAGVADQLQTNFAGDLRNILKCVFQMNATQVDFDVDGASSSPTNSGTSASSGNANGSIESAEEAWESPAESSATAAPSPVASANTQVREPETEAIGVLPGPVWVPDVMAPRCMTCEAAFTLVRRRHHCRNCGKVFCSRCSSNSVPLPRFGHVKPVRVCNRCFLYQVTPFRLEEEPQVQMSV